MLESVRDVYTILWGSFQNFGTWWMQGLYLLKVGGERYFLMSLVMNSYCTPFLCCIDVKYRFSVEWPAIWVHDLGGRGINTNITNCSSLFVCIVGRGCRKNYTIILRSASALLVIHWHGNKKCAYFLCVTENVRKIGTLRADWLTYAPSKKRLPLRLWRHSFVFLQKKTSVIVPDARSRAELLTCGYGEKKSRKMEGRLMCMKSSVAHAPISPKQAKSFVSAAPILLQAGGIWMWSMHRERDLVWNSCGRGCAKRNATWDQ